MNRNRRDDPSAWEKALDAALIEANVPTLLMILVHLTGEAYWFSSRFRCDRIAGLDDDGSGGLDADVRREVIAAARAAILRWKQGASPARPTLPLDSLVAMMRTSSGENIPDGYGSIIAAGLGQDEEFSLDRHRPLPLHDGFRVVIIGAGIAGLCLAIRLQHAGIPYIVIEKNAGLGGTWHENRYPGAGVDTPSHIYSYSFAKHDWTMHFALQEEINAYFEEVAGRHGVRPNIRFNCAVRSARYDEDGMRWSVEIADESGRPETVTANVLVSAVGYLNVPKIPPIKGLGTFSGPLFHTARWPQDLDLRGRRVALIGNGASAMQIAPAIAGIVDRLTIFQRSKQWAAPFKQFRQPISRGARFLLREVPFYQEWYRQRLLWIFNDRIHASLQVDPAWPTPERAINAQNDRHRQFFTDYVKSELGARQDLLPDVLPDYPPFGKRMLMDNGWYRTLTRPNVRLVPEAVAEVTPTEIISSSGSRFAADILIAATGFDAVNMLASFQLFGKGGRSIGTAWRENGAEAFMGMSVPGFPNFFILSGPNTGLGHGGSIVALIESQARYILGILEKLLSAHGARFEIDVRQPVFDEYNRRVQKAHDHMIWTHGGMSNWYRNDKGRVVVLTPFRNDENWHAARRTELGDFTIETSDSRTSRPNRSSAVAE